MVVSMDVELAEAARMMGVSAVRARQLAREGRLRARQVGGRWLVDAASLPSAPRRGRPMSPRIAWALVEIGAGRSAEWIEPRESYRLRRPAPGPLGPVRRTLRHVGSQPIERPAQAVGLPRLDPFGRATRTDLDQRPGDPRAHRTTATRGTWQ